jgi:hypothetical protein
MENSFAGNFCACQNMILRYSVSLLHPQSDFFRFAGMKNPNHNATANWATAFA